MDFKHAATNALTKDQVKARDLIMKWLQTPININDTSTLEFTLKGYAGTGKTFLLGDIMKHYKKSTCITAPTHKALKKAKESTKLPGKTIQSLHGLRPNFNLDFEFNNIQFDTIGIPGFASYSLIIIDESSMINKSVRALNLIRAKQYQTKILYVGDDAQLLPIKESTVSSVFQIKGCALTEIIRQSEGNPLLDILQLARNDVFTNKDTLLQYLYKNKSKINSQGEGYVCLPKQDFLNSLILHFQNQKFYEDVDYARYGSYTNPNILAWNNEIRRNLISDYQNVISEDDLLVGYATIVDNVLNPIIINSYDYAIKNITPRTTEDGFEVFASNLIDIDGKEKMISIVNHTSDTYGKFLHKLLMFHKQAKTSSSHDRSKNWNKFYDYKNRHLSLIPIPSPHAPYPIPKDIDYGYGLTIHKLQGSTIENMFVNIPDIIKFSTGRLNPDRQRLLYTAISRASHKVIFLL